MQRKKDFPRYDDLQHIDSGAVRRDPVQRAPMSDPSATAYTEMYCAPTQAVEPAPQPKRH